MTARYPWIPARPVPRRLPPLRRRGGFRESPIRPHRPDPCPICGYDPIGRRKKCPACLAPALSIDVQEGR